MNHFSRRKFNKNHILFQQILLNFFRYFFYFYTNLFIEQLRSHKTSVQVQIGTSALTYASQFFSLRVL